MKMENPIVAHVDGVVSDLRAAVGEQIASGQVICLIRPAP
jgi:biotin carboxyl carrier protein